MRAILVSKWTKVIVFLLCLIPFADLLWRLLRNDLGINPVETLQHGTGDWTIRFIVFTLCITPFRKVFKLPDLIRFRRMLGLLAFFYVCLHFLTYLGPDQSFDVSGMWKDVAKRPFITVGFAAFVSLIPLAITSTAGWIRRIGGKRWQQLHRLIYFAAVCGVVHYYWLVKSDVRRPVFYGALVAILLFWRLVDWFLKRRSQVPARVPASRVSVNS
ncbi:MAG TPA: protein-methionine-sulfoxide reductase heme-binding subunit MsrQ [Candidatus Acidoferrum sp.]|nr:protein-methionine-sulfoxide reductase heme-binding subunit MsrQ [Candidatus Acidoferrum sp.]